MKELINLARGFSQQFECALIYGIANVAQLDNLFKVNAKQFVIVEADPNVFSKLEEWHSTLPESAPTVSCYHSAITQEDGPTTLLYQASQPGFSSTVKPNQIKRFRPGLTFSSVSVPAKKLSYFTDKYAITANQHNIALFNCNGAEHQILSDSTSQLFSTIVVKTCSKALFGENTQLPAALTDTGYSQVKIKSAQPPMSLTALCKPLLVLKQASALEKARHEAEQYKQQVSDLIAQNETLTEQRDNQREHHLKNKEWAEQLQSQKQDLETQLEQSENKAKQLSEKLESANAELQATQAREKSLQEKLEAETSKHKKLNEDNEGLSSKVATLNSESAAIRDEMQQAQSNVQELVDKLEKANQALSAQDEGKRETLEQLKVLKEKCAQLESSLATTQKERDEQKEHHLKNKEWAEQLKSQKQALEAQLEQSENQAKHLSENLESVNAELQAAQAREKSQLEKLEAETSKHKKLSEDNKGLSSQVATLNSESAAIRDEMQQAQSNVQELVDKLEKANQALSAQEEGKRETLEQLRVLKEKCAQLESSLATTQKERDEQKEHHFNNKKWAEGLNESNKALQAKLKQLEPEFNKLSEQHEALKIQLSNVEKREAQLTSALTLNTKLLTKMQSDSEHLREQYKEKVKSEEELKKLVSELHQKLQQAATFYHKLEQQYPELLSETLSR